MEIQTSLDEIIGFLRKFKDAEPAESHHALKWTERQKSRIEGLGSRLLLWRPPPQWMRDDLENVYMLLFWFVGNGFQLPLCNVSWLMTRKFVVLVQDAIVFVLWSVLLDSTASFLSPVNTHLTTSPSRAGSKGRARATGTSNPLSMWCCVPFCPMHHHKSLGKASKKGDFVADEEDDPGELRQPVVGVGGTHQVQAGNGSLCDPRKPRKTFALTADEGWLSNP